MENQEVKKTEAKKNKQPKAAKEKNIRLHVQEAHQRLNFLHQIALQISSESTQVNDGFAKLSRNIGKHFRGVLDTETVKVEPAMRRMFCKNCKQVFLAKMTEISVVELKAVLEEGVAPIKAEFRIPREELIAQDKSLANNGQTEAVTVEIIKAEHRDDRKKRRGMNKDRRKEMKHAETNIRAAAVRLCPSVVQPVACKFGDKCTSEHDVKIFMEKKPADIPGNCPLFDFRGTCPFSYACRFNGSHMDEEGKQIEKEPAIKYLETVNIAKLAIQVGLRKRTYDFTRSDEALKAVKEKTIGAMEREKPKVDVKSFKGKKYLAPLTTVGNLPFRRICVDYGADITCGEMAVATSILAGSSSEYSLVKRHPSEKIFGVQLAGGYADTMSKAAQIIVDEFDVDFIDINMGCPIDVINEKGGGCALANRSNKMIEVLSTMRLVMKNIPLTVKIRTGLKEGILTADETVKSLVNLGPFAPDLITLHPRSKEQRYTRLAKWDFVKSVAHAAGEIPLWACGDVISWESYYEKLENYPIEGVMIARGALIKPWLFTEIDERRTWDITATERFDLMKKFVNYGLDHWGSDDAGVERTRRFLLEWLSFTCRYIPVGLLEVLPQKINDRPPQYRGRNELETLLSSQKASDWVEISRRLLGPTPDGFTFIPKHKASSY